MHLDRVRVGVVGLSLLAACESAQHGSREPLHASEPSSSPDSDPALVVGGETSPSADSDPALTVVANTAPDFVYGYCPRVVSRSGLDLEREDVAQLVALAQGQHEVPLRWRRELPDERVRGFEERTSLLLDVQVIAAEDVVCEAAEEEGFETLVYRASLRRLELAVQFSTADGALQGAFQQPFVSTFNDGEPYLSGVAGMPMGELEGTLELDFDPEFVLATASLSIHILFAEQTVQGNLSPWIALDGSRPSWALIDGRFPAPDEGCNSGSRVPLDEVLNVLGDTPRAAYERGRSSLPAEPLRAAWQDTSQSPTSVTWTQLTLRPGAPTHACRDGDTVDVYTFLRLESADGLVAMDQPAVANVQLQPALAGQPRSVGELSLSGSVGWTRPAEFETTAGIQDLDLGLAEYGSLYVYQSFNVDRDELQGALGVSKRDKYGNVAGVGPGLVWCGGPACDRYWCVLTAPDGGISCYGL